MTATVCENPNQEASGLLPRTVAWAHQRLVHGRRIGRLADAIVTMKPTPGRWLDVGCGDGRLARTIMDRVPSLEFSGIDVQPRSASAIPVSGYDGRRIDHEDGAFTGTLICDVLHHTDDVESVLREVARVSGSTVIIKDSIADSWVEHKLLSIMDVVGNRPYGVPCPFNFLSSEQWADVFDRIGLSVVSRQRSLHLYPVPFSYIFDGRLHFVASLKKR